MKRTAVVFFTMVLVLAAGCDPRITIRQVLQPGATNNSRVLVSVRDTHSFIGETWYAAKVTVTNSSVSPITLGAVELVARGATYKNRPPATETYPLIVPPGTAQALGVWFDLRENVNRTFQEPAELRLHYRTGGKDEIAQVSVIGGPLTK